jgi:hypothetical protein
MLRSEQRDKLNTGGTIQEVDVPPTLTIEPGVIGDQTDPFAGKDVDRILEENLEPRLDLRVEGEGTGEQEKRGRDAEASPAHVA